MKIFVLHYSRLADRKQFILSQFARHHITDFEFIECYDKDEITEKDSSLFADDYKKSTMSLHLKHFYVYRLIAEKYDNALIFEDDVVLCDNFTNLLHSYLEELPKDYDMLFIGDGCKLHIPNSELLPNKHIYEKCVEANGWTDGCSRCSDSYVVSKKCAVTLCKYIDNYTSKIQLPIDWWINVAGRDNRLNVYWAEPTIITQGSQNGTFSTSL